MQCIIIPANIKRKYNDSFEEIYTAKAITNIQIARVASETVHLVIEIAHKKQNTLAYKRTVYISFGILINVNSNPYIVSIRMKKNIANILESIFTFIVYYLPSISDYNVQ